MYDPRIAMQKVMLLGLLLWVSPVWGRPESPSPSIAEMQSMLSAAGLKGAEDFQLSEEQFSPDLFEKWHWFGAPEYASDFDGRDLVTQLWQDLDGDERAEYAVVLREGGAEGAPKVRTYPGLHFKANPGKGRLAVAVFGRSGTEWRLLHKRLSGEKNHVLMAFLEAVPAGVRVHVFEARFQCDDERPEAYDLFWDNAARTVGSPFSGEGLHPFERDWNCGE